MRATLADLARSNALFGGLAAVQGGIDALLAGRAPGRVTLVDVGAGGGDVLVHVMRRLRARGHVPRAVALDHHRTAARICRARGLAAVVADLGALPLAARSADIVMANQVLHHLPDDGIVALLAACSAVARRGVVVTDLRRSVLATVAVRIAAWVLRFHPATRADAVLSLQRAFRIAELRDFIRRISPRATVRRRWGWRLLGVWRTDYGQT